MKKIIFIISFIIFSLTLPLVSFALSADAVDIKLNIKDSFGLDEKVSFDYTITSKSDVKIIYLPYIECPNTPRPFLQEQTIDLKANQEFLADYQDVTVTQDIEPQTCLAYIQIINPIQKRVEKEFKIEIEPSLDLKVYACKDENCEKKSKVYQVGESVYLIYKTSLQDINTKVQIIDPQGKEKENSLPVSYKLEKAGKYVLDFTAQAQGYKIYTKKIELTVLSHVPIAIDTKVCNSNYKCEDGEAYNNCPTDCVLKRSKLFLILSVVLFVLAIILFIFFLRFIKKK